MTCNKKVFLIILIFLLFQIPLFFSNIPSDDSVYYLMAREVSRGAKPYIDFELAHPPLQIFFYSIIIKLFGLNIPLLKLITALFTIGSAIFIFKLTKKRYNECVGIIAMLLFLTTVYVFNYSSNAFGVELSLFFFLCALYYYEQNPFKSGLFFAIAVATRLHLVILVLLFFSKDMKKMQGFALGLFALVPYYGILLFIPGFPVQVFLMHAAKIHHAHIWPKMLLLNWHLLILFCIGLKKRKDNIILYGIILYLIFLIGIKSIFGYYFLPLIALLCVTAAKGFVSLQPKHKKIAIALILAWLLILNGRFYVHNINRFKTMPEFEAFILTYDRDMIGKADIVSLLALKTNKNIHLQQIDTNYQKQKIYNYTNALVIYNEDFFDGESFNCTFETKWRDTTEPEYSVWLC